MALLQRPPCCRLPSAGQLASILNTKDAGNLRRLAVKVSLTFTGETAHQIIQDWELDIDPIHVAKTQSAAVQVGAHLQREETVEGGKIEKPRQDQKQHFSPFRDLTHGGFDGYITLDAFQNTIYMYLWC